MMRYFPEGLPFIRLIFSMEAYKRILGRSTIWTSMRTTVIITLLGTALSLVLTTFAALALSINDLPGKKVLTGMILFRCTSGRHDSHLFWW